MVVDLMDKMSWNIAGSSSSATTAKDPGFNSEEVFGKLNKTYTDLDKILKAVSSCSGRWCVCVIVFLARQTLHGSGM
eukprot:2156989-Alexandrium_andersonii.AAC.1